MTKKLFLLFIFLLMITIPSYPQSTSNNSFPETITIPYLEQISLPINTSFKRFLAMNPKAISVVRTKELLIIKALRVGESTLLIWEDKRVQITVKVIPPPKRKSFQQNRLEEMIAAKNSVSFMTNFSYRKATFGKKIGDPDTSSGSYGAGLSIKSPFFKGTYLSLGFDVDIQSNKDNLSLSSISISNITWPESQRYSIFLGDIYDSSTSSSFSGSSNVKGIIINPLKFQIHKKFNPVKLKITYGEREERTGSFISINSRDLSNSNSLNNSLTNSTKSRFIRTEIKYDGIKQSPQANIFHKSWTANIFNNFNEEESFFYDYNLKLTKKDSSINIGVGGKSNQTSYAVSYSKAIFNNLSTTLSRNYIPNKMTVVGSDSILNENITNMLYIRYSPNFQSDYFKFNSFNFSFTNNETKRDSADTETKNSYSLNTGVKFLDYNLSLGYSIKDSKKTINPMESNNFNLNLTKSFQCFLPIRYSLRYAETQRTRFDNITTRFESQSFGYFISTKIFKKIGYSFNQSSHKNQETNEESQKNNRLNHSLSYSFNLFKNLIKGNCSYRYSQSTNHSTIINDSIFHSFRTSFSSSIGENTRLRLNYLLEQEEKENSDDNEVRSIIEATVSSRFHTFFGWKPKTEIDVLAFYDVNYNGKYDEDIDRPLKKADILVNKEVRGQTNDLGSLYLGKIKGFNKIISISRETIPRGYVFSTPSKYSFNKLKSSKESCVFGLILNTEISGTVYNDLNGDSIFDRQDEPLLGITVLLSSGKMVTTDSNGRYFFSPVAEGENEICIDALSLPIGFRSISKSKKTVYMEKGSIIKEDFGFQAIRILKVKIFIKKGRSNKQISNIEIMLNNEKKKAKRKGIYKFSKINYGTQILTIPLDKLPFKVLSCFPEPLNFHPGKSKFIEIPIFFDKDPETKNVSIILKKID